MKCIGTLICAFIFSIAAGAQEPATAAQILREKVQEELGKQKGLFAVAFKDLTSGETLFWNEHDLFHAASTMKTPVMIEVYKQVAAGKFLLTDSVTVRNEFISIVDSSTYQLNPGDDSDRELYKLEGKKLPLSDLVYRMIIRSSNLATNIIMGMVDGKRVTQSMRELGAKDMLVLRGVEDAKAYQRGLNNVVTAYDLMTVYEKMARNEIIDASACRAMINILLDQEFGTIIPALLPKDVKVAHKTGSITGVHHDSGIVFLPDGKKYVLVILSRNLEDAELATPAMAKVSEMIYRHVIGKP